MSASFQKTCILAFVIIDFKLDDVCDSFECSLHGYEKGDNIAEGGTGGENFVLVKYHSTGTAQRRSGI